MVHVYTTRINTTHADDFSALAKLLSLEDQMKAARFTNTADQHRLIAGKLSLRFALHDLGIDTPGKSISYSAYGRPWLGRGLDFNISHSGNIVVCAISQTEIVGIDIEEINAIDYRDFKSCFSPSEWKTIEAHNTLRTFYIFWTMKESAIKANGKGLSIPLSEVHIQNDSQVSIHSEMWHITPLSIDPAYICHVASLTPTPAIRIICFDINSFLK
jgi:4'-phosphopantetheinyl transferase